MNDIAAQAGYTRRTLYAYFKSRDEIYLMVLIEDWQKRWEMQKQEIEKIESGLDKIICWGEVLYDFSRSNPHATKLQYYWDYKGIDKNKISKEVFTHFESLNNIIADGLRNIFQIGFKDRSLRPDLEIDICISQYLYTLRQVIHRALSSTYTFTDYNPDEYVNHYLELFKRGISKGKTK